MQQGPQGVTIATTSLSVVVVGINFAPEMTGIGPYTTAMARGLARRGHRVRAVTGLPHYPQWRVDPAYRSFTRGGEMVDRVCIDRVRHYVPRTARVLERLRMEVSFGFAALRSGLGHPDVVVVVSPPLVSAMFIVVLSRIRRIPVGIVVQDVYARAARETDAMPRLPGLILGLVERCTLTMATAAIVIHERFVGVLAQMGVSPDKISVIRNWSHVAVPPQVDRSAVRARYGWSSDCLVVVHGGNIGVKQGLENVVRAAELADIDRAPVLFVILGDGNRRAHIEEMCAGVERVQLLRPLPESDFAEILLAADVLLVNERPGVSETAAPSKLTSYFACGRPILAATDPDGVTADEVRASGAGVVIAAGNPRLLLDTALEMSDDSDTAALGRSGAVYARAALDETDAIDRYERWCRTLAGQPS